MNVQALITPANIAPGLISVDVRLRFADGTKDARHLKIPVNFANPLRAQIATFVVSKALSEGHTVTHIVWPDFTVQTL